MKWSHKNMELILNLIIKRAMSSAPNRLPSSSRWRQQACAILGRTWFKLDSFLFFMEALQLS